MAESSTPNPFEPDLKPDSREPELEPENLHSGDAPQESANTPGRLRPILPVEPENKPQKLKLKQILTPLSPHLTAPRPETDDRLTKKDSFTPSPKAVPVEPEPELTEEELAARDMASGTGIGGLTPEIETTPPTPEELSLQPDEVTGEEPEAKEPEEEKAPARKADPVAKKKPKSRKLVLALAVPVILLAAIAFLVNSLFDPLGLKIQPIEQLPDLTLMQKAPETAASMAVESDSSHLLDTLEEESVERYLSLLEEKAVLAGANADGLFINAVYYRTGTVVNPRHGLTLVAVEGDGQTILLEDAQGRAYRIAMR